MSAPLSHEDAALVDRYVLDCDSRDGDQVAMVYQVRNADESLVVVLGITSPVRETGVVYLAPAAMRELASELLNRADAIEGKVPLVFFPPGAPTATYPPGHPSA